MLLRSGWAYVPETEQASIVNQEFEMHLEKALEVKLTKVYAAVTDGFEGDSEGFTPLGRRYPSITHFRKSVERIYCRRVI